MPVHVPQGSTVVITCTTANSSFSPFWTVDLANDSSTQLQFSSKSDELNAHGVYELPQMEIPEINQVTLRLLINNTADNNQTMIYCDRGGDSIQTILYVFSKQINFIKFWLIRIMMSSPEVARPCEVYNFSVTATYVGATYTGDGCSVPSPVLSRMLPSLPNITRLESSVTFSLVNVLGDIVLSVLFEVSILIASNLKSVI